MAARIPVSNAAVTRPSCPELPASTTLVIPDSSMAPNAGRTTLAARSGGIGSAISCAITAPISTMRLAPENRPGPVAGT